MLTYIQCLCFQNNTIYTDTSSPFKKAKNNSRVWEKLNEFIPHGLYNPSRLDGNTFFKFDITCIRELFELNDYINSIMVSSSVNECLQRIEDKNHSGMKINYYSQSYTKN